MLVKVSHFSKWYRALFARGIQFFDKSFYHHAVLWCNVSFHEADTKVIARELDHYDGDNVVVLELINGLSVNEKMLYIQFCQEQLGKKYDYFGALFYQLLYRTTGVWIGHKGSVAERREFCSEHCLTPINKVRGYFADKYKWSPGDIFRKGGMYYKVKWEGVFQAHEWCV
jgi:hypothetical protein